MKLARILVYIPGKIFDPDFSKHLFFPGFLKIFQNNFFPSFPVKTITIYFLIKPVKYFSPVSPKSRLTENPHTQASQQFMQSAEEGNNGEDYERQSYVAADDDESFPVTTSSSESSKPVDVETSAAVSSSTKREDVKLVKQLLDSESDDTSSRSNLLNTAIKEEEKEDESDFDFSTN